MKALQALEQYDYTKGTFSAWVYRIASREIAMYFRRLNTIGKHASGMGSFHDDAVRARNESVKSEMEEAWNQLENSDDFIAITPYLCKLPRKYREVVFLRYFEDRTLEETASILGRPTGTVKAQCHRGLRLLRRWMQQSEQQALLESVALNTILEKGP